MAISRKKRRLLWALLAVPPVYLAILGARLNAWGQTDRAEPADAIIILGARVREGGKASPLLRERTRRAYELWKQGLAPLIICTGGVGTYPPAESVVEDQLLREWGVPESAILREEKSTSTRENTLYAAQFLPKGARVIVISEPFHLWRARRDCEKVGLKATTSPDLAGWNQLFLWQRNFYCLREAILVTRDVILG